MKKNLLSILTLLLCAVMFACIGTTSNNVFALENALEEPQIKEGIVENQQIEESTNETTEKEENSSCCNIIVKGFGESCVKPDTAKIKFAINTMGENAQEIEKENLNKVNTIIAKLKELNVKKEDIKSISLSMYQKYDYSSGEQVLLGTEVSNILEIKTKNLENLTKIISSLTENGVSEIFAVNMSVEDYNSAYNNALSNALENAKEKAKVLALNKQISECKILEDCMCYSPLNVIRYDAKTIREENNANQIMQNEICVKACVIVEFCAN